MEDVDERGRRVVRCLLHAPPLRHPASTTQPRLRLPSRLAPILHTMSTKHWLMKAEPDSRIVKGKDVKVRPSDVVVCARLSSGNAVVQRGRLRGRQDDALGGGAQC